jgi:hypothetical protein
MKKSITLALLLLSNVNFMSAMEDTFFSATLPKAESNGSTFERLPMDEMDRWHAQNAAKKYQEYLRLNEKLDTITERKNFIQENNQNPDCFAIHNIVQISQGFNLLRQEQISRQISHNKYNQIASSGAVIAHILGLEQVALAKKNTQSPERTLDAKDEEALPLPSLSSSSTPSSGKTTPTVLIPRKSRPFDNESPLMIRLKEEENQNEIADLCRFINLEYLPENEPTKLSSEPTTETDDYFC